MLGAFAFSELVDEHCLKEMPAFLLDNEAIYKGDWVQNKRQGHGIQIWKNGTKYVGYWRGDQP